MQEDIISAIGVIHDASSSEAEPKFRDLPFDLPELIRRQPTSVRFVRLNHQEHSVGTRPPPKKKRQLATPAVADTKNYEARSTAPLPSLGSAALTSQGSHWALNIGASVWSISLSECIPCPKRCINGKSPKKKQDTCSNCMNAFLAVGTAPEYCPMSQSHQTLHGPGLIQIWAIGARSNDEPRYIGSFIHDGVICRSLRWIRSTATPNKLPLLLCVTGDGRVSLYSLPRRLNFQSGNATFEKSVWDVRPAWTFDARRVLCADAMLSENPDENGRDLHLVAGCANGTFLRWIFRRDFTLGPYECIAAQGALTAIALMPPALQPHDKDPRHVVVGTDRGKLSVWDADDAFDKQFELEFQERPVFAVDWSCCAKFVAVAHSKGYIANTAVRESYAQKAFMEEGSTELTAWDCAFFGSIGFFAYSEGFLAFGDMTQGDKRKPRPRLFLLWGAETPDSSCDVVEASLASKVSNASEALKRGGVGGAKPVLHFLCLLAWWCPHPEFTSAGRSEHQPAF